MNHIIDKLALVVIVLALLVFLYIAYLLYYPVTVVVPNLQPYKIMTPKVKLGGQVIYQADICKKIPASAIASRRFVDGVIIQLPDQISDLPVGCQKSNISLTVPKELKPGIWHIEFAIIYKINPLRDKVYYFKTENFEVDP